MVWQLFVLPNLGISISVIATFYYLFLVSAMLFLREHNVAHMDLKPQNILLTSVTNPTMKIAGTSFYRFGIITYSKYLSYVTF